MANIQKITANEINQLHGELIGLFRQSIDKAVQIGERLTEVKKSLPHGEFTSWMKEHISFSDRTGRNYMKLFNNKDKALEAGSISEAYRLIDGKTETVSDMKPLIGTKRLPKLCYWYDIFAPYVLILDAIGWDFSQISHELNQPKERIQRVLNPTPHRFTADLPPDEWDESIQREISGQLSEMYEKASWFAIHEGLNDVSAEMKVLSKYHKKRGKNLNEFFPFDKKHEGEQGEFLLSVWVLMLNVVRDAIGVESMEMGRNWICSVIDMD